jgi:hypothetical protein
VTLVNGTPTFDSRDVANHIPVHFTDFSLDGAQAGNIYPYALACGKDSIHTLPFL